MNINLLSKEKTVCFTGHRVQKLPWRSNETDERCVKMKETLRAELKKAIMNGYNTFLCGMALGFDLICAEEVISLRETYKDIRIYGALPCMDQQKMWHINDKLRYQKLLEKLDGIRCLHETYCGSECFLERNRFMVDNSSLMIALYNGVTGGTKSTVDYARKKGLEIVIIKP